jgi:hypothetical protein
MTIKHKAFLEFFDAGYIVRIETQSYLFKEADNNWDKNWLKTFVTVKGGKFSGQYPANFMTIDFRKFKDDLLTLHDNYNGSAEFSGRDGYLELKIKGDGLGHFELNVVARDEPNYGGQLTFEMAFDQTSLDELIEQLDNILSAYPVIGDM